MTEKELRKLNRAELLEMLIAQSKEVEALQKQLKQADEKLKNRQIMIDRAGSIAEAALQLNGVFQAAEKAAAQYLENIALQEQNSREQAEKLLSDAQHRCSVMEKDTQKKCDDMLQHAQQATQKARGDVSDRVAQIVEARTERQALFARYGIGTEKR